MDKIRRAFLPVFVFAKIDTRRLFRDKMAIFFVFLFPLIFLFIFGGIFGRDSEVSFNVALLNESETEFAKQFVDDAKENEVIEVKEDIETREKADEAMSQSQIDAILILPEDFGAVQPGKKYPSGTLEIVYSESNRQSGQTLVSIMEGVFDDINEGIVGPQEQPFVVDAQSDGKEGLSSFDYLFPGLLGFTILGMGLFGPTTVFPRMKQRGVLRRYHTTSLKVWQFVIGNEMRLASGAAWFSFFAQPPIAKPKPKITVVPIMMNSASSMMLP